MEKKYLKVISRGFIETVDTITKYDLASVLNGSIDMIINLTDMTWFDADENEWKEIKHR